MKPILALALIVLTFAGCGRAGSPVRHQAAPPPAAATSVTPAEESDPEKDAKEKNP